MVVLVAIFMMHMIFLVVQKRYGSQSGIIALVSILAVSTIPTTIDSIRIAPYQYTQYSALIFPSQIDGNWPTDYWKVSLRESLAYVDVNGLVYCQMLPPGPVDEASAWVLERPSVKDGQCGS